MRLFFALWPDDKVRAKLAKWGRALHDAAGGRPTLPDKLHMTLVFLGDTEAGRLAELAAISSAQRCEPFTLTLSEAGYWKRQRIAWAGAPIVPAALERMLAELRGALERASFRYDPKPFVPHVTLVRKAREPLAIPVLAPIEWKIDGFVLMESVPGTGGASYAVRGGSAPLPSPS